ncbi:MAG TPA: tetratricopeptide repeat protein, partial [Chthoniobacterales bacterium]
ASLVTLVTQAKAISSLESLTLSERIANAARGMFTYIGQMFYPVTLAPFYPLPADGPGVATTVLFVALFFGLTGGALLVRRRSPYVTVGWLWYVVMLVPVSGLIQAGAQAHADRYTYLPHIGLYVIAAWAAVDVFGRRRYARPILSTAAAVVILAAAAQAWRQTRIWRDSEALWRHALAVTEPNYISHGSLARFLCSKRRVAEAVPHFEAALAIRPDDVAFHKNVAAGLVQLGRPAEAIAHLEKALEIEPNDSHAQADLAWVCATSPESSMRDGARALRLAQSAIAGRGERTPSLLRTLSAAHAEIGEFAEAIEAAREALQLAKGLGQKDVVEALESVIRGYELARLVRNASHDRDDMEAD